MKSYTSEEIRENATRLAWACQAAGLDAEQCGAEILIRGVTRHLDERIVCRPDARGDLRWHWSWGAPIGVTGEGERMLGADEIEELVRSINKVVSGPARKM